MPGKILKAVSLICFVLATFGLGGAVLLVPLGLAFYVAADLVQGGLG